jgi:hypothetical protein
MAEVVWDEDASLVHLCKDLFVAGVRSGEDAQKLAGRIFPKEIGPAEIKRRLKDLFEKMSAYYLLNASDCASCRCANKAISLFCPRCDKMGIRIYYCSIVCCVEHQALHKHICGK